MVLNISWMDALLIAIGTVSFGASAAAKPHILMILADDYGWANVGYHRSTPTEEVQTPNIDALVKSGIELDRHYVFQYCSPSRSALQSGRNPIHVNVANLAPTNWNPKDPVSGFAGIPRNMTGIAEKMKLGGYRTHMAGKWDAGMATPDHTPMGRGYESSMHYFHHANDYWDETCGSACSGKKMVDLWHTDRPAKGINNSFECSQKTQEGCVYEDELFRERIVDYITLHDPATPLFIFWAPHIVHSPLQVPQSFVDKFSFIDDPVRQYYAAMVNYMDTSIGEVVNALREKEMFDDTLIVFSSDNGGPIYQFGSSGGNNFPLKGGKCSNWEGGVRVNAWVSGGFVPESLRGTKQESYVTLWDWYATFCGLAGVDPQDERAKKADLPPIGFIFTYIILASIITTDSFDQWPFLSGQVKTSPRTEIPLGIYNCSGFPEFYNCVNSDVNGKVTVNGLIRGDYKVLVGDIGQSGWTGPQFPNSTRWNPSTSLYHCGKGCLFNIKEDPTEHVDIAKSQPEVLEQMLQRLAEHQKTVFSPDRGNVSPKACEVGLGKYDGFWGPFVP